MVKIKKAFTSPGEILPYLRRAILRRLLIRRVKKDGRDFVKYRGELYPAYLDNKRAASFIVPRAKPYCRGVGIDVGAGVDPFPGAVPIQNEEQQNAYRLDNFADGSLDYVFSSHCLEHLERWQQALALWIRKLKAGGYLFLYLPHHSMPLWQPGGLWAGNDHKWSPRVEVLIGFLAGHQMEVLDYNPGKDQYYSFHILAQKLAPGSRTSG